MMLCSVCKKNYAVVFITKIINGKQKQEGLCLSCAKKQGIEPIKQMIDQTGMTDKDIDMLNKQMSSLFENMDMESLSESMDMQDNEEGNPFFKFITKAFPKNDAIKDHQKRIEDSFGDSGKNDGYNTKTRTQYKRNSRKKKYLGIYGTNLTDMAKKGKVDRVVGRHREIDRVIQILNRRTKNNPVLVGEPGVGKTAIAEGLAVRIAESTVPAKLLDAEIVLLDLTALVAGTQFRGQFESRMRGLIEEAKSFGNIILVIDELHNIIGAGEAEGAINAANILKPALSRGEIQVVGATTLKEYRKHIEKDSALERRFQPVIVDEPSMEDSIEILKGIKEYYQKYHMVKISDEIIKSAVLLSERYITDRYLPDKAIDVIDEACSRANLRNTALVELQALKSELERVQEDKENAISADSIEDYQKAADLKVRECKLLTQIREIEKKNEDYSVTIEDIAHVVESWTGVPVQRITELETHKLLNMEERLHKRIVGQERAVESVAKTIRRNRAGFRKKKKPASFVFVGPTGVGKTELVKALAVELFESEEALIRLDMSEYMEKHAVSKMVGAPPGYIGYDEAGQLTEQIRKKPYSVILLDEIEKAHPDVFNLLLQILDDGRLTDSHGRVVSFENAIIIMTSNAGTTLKAHGIGFNKTDHKSMESRINDIMKEIFRPEFLNRIDEIIVFNELNRGELKKIIELMLDEVRTDLAEKDMKLEVSEASKEFLLQKGYDPKYGARPLRRLIQKHIEDELAEHYLKGKYSTGDTVKIDCADGKIHFSKGE